MVQDSTTEEKVYNIHTTVKFVYYLGQNLYYIKLAKLIFDLKQFAPLFIVGMHFKKVQRVINWDSKSCLKTFYAWWNYFFLFVSKSRLHIISILCKIQSVLETKKRSNGSEMRITHHLSASNHQKLFFRCENDPKVVR